MNLSQRRKGSDEVSVQTRFSDDLFSAGQPSGTLGKSEIVSASETRLMSCYRRGKDQKQHDYNLPHSNNNVLVWLLFLSVNRRAAPRVAPVKDSEIVKHAVNGFY